MNKKLNKLVVRQAIRVVDLDQLNLDGSYQREVREGHKKIVADFNEDALGVPLVAERPDGTLWIVDGLQRVTALRKLGKTKVRAEVFSSSGPEHEAEVFKLVNMNRTKLTSGEQFRAMLTSQDVTAWKIKESVEACGFRLTMGKSSRDGTASQEVSCFKTLLKIMKMKDGTGAIKFALNTVKDCWPDDKLGTYNTLIEGLAIFYDRMDGVPDMERLIPRLQTVTCQKVLYTASQMSLSASKAYCVAQVLEGLYRKRISHKRGS